MTHESIPSPKPVKRETIQILEQSESYALFDRWIDEQLEQLVAKWIHRAAPNSKFAANRQKFGR